MKRAASVGPARKILITGASVAGNALAWWLAKRGFDVTVVERHPHFREGGQNIDVRGAGREVLKKMGLEQAVADSGTGETGVRFVDADDKTVAQFDVDELGADGPTAELEILRGDLARIFYDACGQGVAFRFDDTIEAVAETGNGVDVYFKSGARAEFDLVVVAEGVGSATRELVFPNENKPRWLDVTMGYFTIPKAEGDGSLCRIFTAGEGRSIWLRPDNKGTTRAILTVQKEPNGDDRLTREAQVSFLRERFDGVDWEADRVLRGLETTDDLYFDVLRQVKMEQWSKGRVVLTGDVGAYVLAGELARSPDIQEALKRYEEILRPYVQKGQNVPKFAPKMLQPQTLLGVAVQRSVLRIVDTPGIKQLVTKLFVSSADDFELPVYEHVPA